ncbi:MAG: S9 family peptidase [Flavobacteriales bacterium CG_4_10_14_0_2_um_filter_32_8]|nr:MAG: S9 family peptidase [Flavobacteriales bacterium CG_4_10_14_0_2_um_filter_32_8]
MKKLLIILAVFISFTAFSQQKELTLSDAVLSYANGLNPKNLQNLQWVNGTTNYIYLEGNEYNIKTAAGKIVMKVGLEKFKSTFPELKRVPSIIAISATEMVFENENQIVHFDYRKGTVINKIVVDENAENKDYNYNQTALAFTINNNLYVANAANKKIAVTEIADKNIVSGQSIHRQEFGIYKGTFWSPKGTYLAFYQKDETNVTDYPLVDITTYPATLKNSKYPMAGQGSEKAKIGIFNVSTQKTVYLNIDTKDEHYLTNLSWTPDEKYVLVAEVNRGQNHFFYNRYDVATGEKVNTLFEEQNDRWVEPEHDAVFLPKSTTDFLWMSERDGFMNLYLYNTSGKLIKQLTPYQFVVNSIIGLDEKGENVFISTTGEDARNTLTLKVNLSSGRSTIITKTEGVHTTQLSDNGAYLIDNYSSLTIPREIAIVNTATLKSNTILKAENPLKDYKLGSTEFITLKSNDGFDLYGRIIKPANFDANKKYPVLIYVYGGTHAQLVTNSWLGGASLWMDWLATQKDYLVFTLDNRGSENRGFAFESIIHRKSGEAAMEDQLIGVEYLKSLSYVDGNRIAVHGWSYGGFMTCSLMLRHPGIFTTAVAGGPVTDWKYYEVMYGERYMDTPQENPEGYENSRVPKYIENLKGKMLIIHGSVDPTVVPQHSMALLKEAVDKNVQIDFFTYPMHEHNVRGKDRVHLMTKILDYIVENNK